MRRIGFGGGCHWCTEAVFQTLKGVIKVQQGFIAPKDDAENYSEAVLVSFDEDRITLQTLIEIHLRTHKSTSAHSMRKKYRSAIYALDRESAVESSKTLKLLQAQFAAPLITKVLQFEHFKSSEDRFLEYYKRNPKKPFCKTYIDPKLALLRKEFSQVVNEP